MHLNRRPLAIVVINYKMEEMTISFIKSELSKISYPHKIVVVNNAATDNSDIVLCEALKASLIKDLKVNKDELGDIVVISSHENLGFAKGNNLGVELCREWFSPEYILFSNNDIQLKDRDVAERLIEKLEGLPDVGVIGPKVVGLDGINQSPYPYRSFWNRHIWIYLSSLFYSLEKKREKFGIDYPQKAKEGCHYYVMGSFFMVRASDFYDCGMFDPVTFLYAEEVILSERMKSIRKKVYYYPQKTVIHAHGVTTSKFSKGKSNDWLFESECYYYKKYIHTNSLLILIGRFTYHLMKITKGMLHKR